MVNFSCFKKNVILDVGIKFCFFFLEVIGKRLKRRNPKAQVVVVVVVVFFSFLSGLK